MDCHSVVTNNLTTNQECRNYVRFWMEGMVLPFVLVGALWLESLEAAVV
jgi:hypothetical protein